MSSCIISYSSLSEGALRQEAIIDRARDKAPEVLYVLFMLYVLRAERPEHTEHTQQRTKSLQTIA